MVDRKFVILTLERSEGEGSASMAEILRVTQNDKLSALITTPTLPVSGGVAAKQPG